MLWLFIALASYVMLAATSLIDKILLNGSISNPKLYAFYVGILSASAFLFLPFGIWANPSPLIFLTGIAAGAAQIYGSYFYLTALQRFEASRTVPMIGSLVPIFGFFLTVAVSGGAAVLGLKELAGFFLLIAGGWMMMTNGFSIKKRGLMLVLLASFLFASSVVLAKLVYMQLPPLETGARLVIFGYDLSLYFNFLRGFLMMAFGSVIAALTFLLSPGVRTAVFNHRSVKREARPNVLFFAGQVMGGAAFMLQSFAVSLAPQANVPVINAMAGIQYVALFICSIFLSAFFPGILKEKNDSASILQKSFAIALIMAGLAIFALS